MRIYKQINPLLLMLLITLLLISCIVVTAQYMAIKKVQYKATDQSPVQSRMAQDQAGQGQGFESTQSTSQASQNAQTANFQSPMKNWKSRITKKPFGIYVNPKNSPVDPERFTGYHAAVDLEIVSDEANLNVPFFAICNGELKIKEKARGYGGLVAQYCEVNGSSVLVLYGHVNLSTIASSVGENLMAGQQIGFLGEVGPDTDYERKHLHLGIHKGPSLVTSGYVSTQKELENFLDPTLIID